MPEELTPELHVVRGVRVPVRPLGAAAQVHGEGQAVVGDVPALVAVRDVLMRRAGTAVGGLDHPRQPPDRREVVVAGAQRRGTQGAAVGTDLVERVDHQRLLGDALLDRRQLAVGDHHRQHRRLTETGDAVAGVLLVVGQRRPHPGAGVDGGLHLGGRGHAAAARRRRALLLAGRPGQRHRQAKCHGQCQPSRIRHERILLPRSETVGHGGRCLGLVFIVFRVME